jgi:sterol desaturase/sphingolipid hydroxylase (fatty acid hydroxylase superfamily)
MDDRDEIIKNLTETIDKTTDELNHVQKKILEINKNRLEVYERIKKEIIKSIVLWAVLLLVLFFCLFISIYALEYLVISLMFIIFSLFLLFFIGIEFSREIIDYWYVVKNIKSIKSEMDF